MIRPRGVQPMPVGIKIGITDASCVTWWGWSAAYLISICWRHLCTIGRWRHPF